ncbi:hypothetical protein PT974_08983 [Cladobotryum mycophilum]|uniref:Uncharacterized protein n=1 Tax=Cladobotryum mycophilum TaxID=491253 RepID=A0ABR0SF15_9HYPO
MSTVNEQQRPSSPSTAPSRAIRAYPDTVRSVSTSSTMSHGSATDTGSNQPSSRQSSGSYPRQYDTSTLSRKPSSNFDGKVRRRGYMRPHGTDFAASAKSRESVMSLGSIAHLQYYFARTGLLDGKGAQFARKKQPQPTLDLSVLEGMGPASTAGGSDVDSSYASMGSSPDLASKGFGTGDIVQSPIEAPNDDEDFEDSFMSEPDMLPPTVSTYHHKNHVVPKPPTILELKVDLEATLHDVQKSLEEVQARKVGTYQEAPDAPQYPNMPEANTQGWYELQGMHILDVVTLAIRAAKMYYTAHELPDRLDSIKPEKQVRVDLLAVMEVLKQMATRNFKGGMKDEEIKTMVNWIDSVFDILKKEAEIEAAEQAERTGWLWLTGDWTGRELERERQFLMSMDPEAEPLPEWTPASAEDASTPFLKSMQNGLRLVKMHNAVVKKSRRRFGAIPTFHTDTQKPYRCADNLRYWAKAAELRFEVILSVDPLGIVYNSGSQVWLDFEAAILRWCRHVREEITNELA